MVRKEKLYFKYFFSQYINMKENPKTTTTSRPRKKTKAMPQKKGGRVRC